MNSGNKQGYESNRRYAVPHLINWQNSTAHHLSLGRNEGRHDQARTVTQHEVFLNEECLHKQKDNMTRCCFMQRPIHPSFGQIKIVVDR